jgi:RNA polymerase sigma-70 factor (ECF subfamily)
VIHEEDRRLVQRVLAGDEAAFDQFYNAFYDRVFRFCVRRIDNEDIRYDIVQQTLEKAIRYLHSYKGEASLYTWLCQICRNEIANWFQRSGNKSALHVSIDDNPSIRAILESDEYGGLVDESVQAELAQIVHLAIDGLPDRYVSALKFKYLQGMSVDEISIEMNLSYLATESVLARARRAFRKLVEELLAEYSLTLNDIGLKS